MLLKRYIILLKHQYIYVFFWNFKIIFLIVVFFYFFFYLSYYLVQNLFFIDYYKYKYINKRNLLKKKFCCCFFWINYTKIFNISKEYFLLNFEYLHYIIIQPQIPTFFCFVLFVMFYNLNYTALILFCFILYK